MKKIIVSLMFVCATVTVANAQSRAIGARLGYNLEFSYQHALASRNMIDLSVGVTNFYNDYGYIEADCMYDWVFNIRGGWNWYVGPGVGLGYGFGSGWENAFRVSVGGQLGVEYNFGIPLNLSLDWRPMVNVLGFGNSSYHWYNGFSSIALGIRYRF